MRAINEVNQTRTHLDQVPTPQMTLLIPTQDDSFCYIKARSDSILSVLVALKGIQDLTGFPVQ